MADIDMTITRNSGVASGAQLLSLCQAAMASQTQSPLAWNTSYGPNGTLCHVVVGLVGGMPMVARFSSPPTFETAGRHIWCRREGG